MGLGFFFVADGRVLLSARHPARPLSMAACASVFSRTSTVDSRPECICGWIVAPSSDASHGSSRTLGCRLSIWGPLRFCSLSASGDLFEVLFVVEMVLMLAAITRGPEADHAPAHQHLLPSLRRVDDMILHELLDYQTLKRVIG